MTTENSSQLKISLVGLNSLTKPLSPTFICSMVRTFCLLIVLISTQLHPKIASAAQADSAAKQTIDPDLQMLEGEANGRLGQHNISPRLKKLLDAVQREPTDKKTWYSIVEMTTFVAPEEARPEIAIDACSRLVELGEKPFFALGLSHRQLEHWPEALDAFMKSRLALRKAGTCQDKTLRESDVKFLYACLADLLIDSGADDIAVELIREQSSLGHQLELIRHAIRGMGNNDAWESIEAAAKIALRHLPAESAAAKELLFQTAVAQSYQGQVAAFEKSARAAREIETNNQGLNAQCDNLPLLIAARKKQVAESSTPFRLLSETDLNDRIKQLRNSKPIDQQLLLGHFMESVRRIRSSGLNERTKNKTALAMVNDALKELPETTILATQKLELLFLTSQYEQIDKLLAAPRATAFKEVSPVWPLIVDASLLMKSEGKDKHLAAIKLAQQALEDDPSNPFSRVVLLDAYATAGDFSELFPLAKQGMQVNCWRSASMIADYYQFSEKPIDSFMLSSAARKMRQANKPLFAWKRAESLRKLGMDAMAIKLYSDAFDNGFSAFGMRETAIKLCIEQRKYDDALRYCRQEIALAENESKRSETVFDLVPTYLLLAKCHVARGEIRKAENVLVKVGGVNEISTGNTESRDKIKRHLEAASRDKAALVAMSHGKAGLLTSQMSPAAKAVVDLKLLKRQLDHINSRYPWLSRQTWSGHHFDEFLNSKKRILRVAMPADEGAQVVTVMVNRSEGGDLLSLEIEAESSTISTGNCVAVDSIIVQPAKDFFENLASLDFKGAHDTAANFGNDGKFIPLEKFTGIFSAMNPLLKEIETIDFSEAMITGIKKPDGEPEAAVYFLGKMKDGGLLPMECRFDLSESTPRFASFNMGDSVKADFHSIDQRNAKHFVAAFSSGQPEQIANLMPKSKRHLIENARLLTVFQTEFLAAAGESRGIKADSFTSVVSISDGVVVSRARFIAEFAKAEIPVKVEHRFNELTYFNFSLAEHSAWQETGQAKGLLADRAQSDLTNYISATPEVTKQMLEDYGGFSKLPVELLAKEKQQFASWLGDLQDLTVMSADFNEGRWEFFFRVNGSEGQGRAKIFYTIDGFDIGLYSFAVKPESAFAPQPEPIETPAK